MKNLKSKIKELDSQRVMYNTLRALTIRRAVSMLDEGEEGVYTRLAQTYRRIEKRWSVMIGLLANREGALLEMDWNIRTVPEDELPPGTTAKMAQAQAVALRAAYEQIENLREAIKFLHLASFRGFAHLQKTIATGDATVGVTGITRLEPVYQWHMIRNGLYGTWRFDERLTGSYSAAEPFDQKMMIFREVDRPVGEVAMIAYIYEMLGRKDWAGFVEIFGIPDVFFVMPQNTGSDDQAAWQTAIDAMIGAGKGMLPNGSDIKTAGGDIRGTNPFGEFVKFQREDVVLAGTGGKLTMLAESGNGTLAGGAQADVFERIASGEARDISEIFQRAIDVPLLKEKFQGQPVLAWFELAAEAAEDTKALVENIAALAAQGYITDQDQVQEQTGLRVQYVAPPSRESVPALVNRTAAPRAPWYKRLFNRAANAPDNVQEQLLQNGRNAIAAAIQDDMAPVAARLAEILDSTPDSDLFQALEEFQTQELPELAKKVLAAPSAVDAIADTLSAGLFNGVESAVKGRAET
jgi:phage gp29-like protein